MTSDTDGLTPRERALRHVAGLSSGPPVDPAPRVTLNFHPDRVARGETVLEALAKGGVYLSQFATGTSNGGLTARPGGDRWRWESRIFNGAYDAVPAAERPVYGALNFRRRTVGAAPRFGSAHFRLTARTSARTTFCYPDSYFDPSDFGVGERMGLVALALADSKDALDDHIEAQVHGPVRPDGDVEALVLDPCYRGTAVEAAARRLPCPWSGTAASGSPWRSCASGPRTGARSTWTWASGSRSTECSTRARSAWRPPPGGTTGRRSRRCGTTSPVSGPPQADAVGKATRQPGASGGAAGASPASCPARPDDSAPPLPPLPSGRPWRGARSVR